MSDLLMLDTLNPPSPDELVADMQFVGADAIAFYVLRRAADGTLIDNGSWDVSHVQTVRAAGKHVLPILVPGNIPTSQDMPLAIQTAQARGMARGFMAVDIEQFSLPSQSWLRQSIDYARSVHWRVMRYGDKSVLDTYPAGDGDWVSHGLIVVRAGVIKPVPALPAGCVADQYAVNCIINGHPYDASVVDSSVFTDGVFTVGSVGTMGGRINAAPWLPSRLDLVVLGRDRRAYRSWNGGGAGELDGNNNYAAIDHEHTPADGWSYIDWTWDVLNRMVIYAEDMHGLAYVCVVRADGGYDQGWSQLPVEVALPLNAPEAPQPAPDNALRTALKTAVDSL